MKYAIIIIVLTVVIAAAAWSLLKHQSAPQKFRPKQEPPVFYINLEKDRENNKRTSQTLRSIFDDVTRIPGVLHEIGREGCRQAHMNANTMGIAKTKKGEYYIVFEDDVKVNPNSNLTPSKIREIVKRSANTNADMIMLNIQNYPYDVNMVDAPANIQNNKEPPEFYRLLGGIGSGAAYMVKHEFGKKLVDNWKKYPMEHIDLTWHALWPSHIVLVHRPLPFLQRVGASKTGDTNWRSINDPVIQDFNWDEVTIGTARGLAASRGGFAAPTARNLSNNLHKT
jgi:hypothetical protein